MVNIKIVMNGENKLIPVKTEMVDGTVYYHYSDGTIRAIGKRKDGKTAYINKLILKATGMKVEEYMSTKKQ